MPDFKVSAVLTGGAPAGDSIHWFCYAALKTKFVEEHPNLYQNQSGMVIPTYQEELEGRLFMAKSCAEHQQAGRSPGSLYFLDLLRIYQAGFIPEYVWWFLGQPSWNVEQRPKELPAFIRWAQHNLGKHVVETHGGASIDRGSAGASGDKAWGPMAPPDVQSIAGSELGPEALQLMSANRCGDHEKALWIAEGIIKKARALQNDPNARYLCFRSHRELNYFLTGHSDVRRVRVLDNDFAKTMYLKAFLLVQRQSFDEALACLDEVMRLAPLAAAPPREKAFVLNKLHRPEEALSALLLAWDLASRLPENGDQAAAALRGLGVTSVELGDLAKAEEYLQTSLVIEPESQVARGELAHLAQLRQGVKMGRRIQVDTTDLIPQLLDHGIRIFRGRYYGPWPGIGAGRMEGPEIAIDAEGLALLAQLGRVTRLTLSGAKLSRDGLMSLRSLKYLQLLELNHTGFTDAEIPAIENLPELRSLNLFGTAITDAAIERLARLPKLEQLFIGMTQVSDKGLELLNQSKSLRYLDLEGNPISDSTLGILSRLTHLEGLNIACGGSDISDAGVNGLTNLSKLRLLGFIRPVNVSEAAYAQLKSLPALKTLIPSGCAFLYRTTDPIYETIEPVL